MPVSSHAWPVRTLRTSRSPSSRYVRFRSVISSSPRAISRLERLGHFNDSVVIEIETGDCVAGLCGLERASLRASPARPARLRTPPRRSVRVLALLVGEYCCPIAGCVQRHAKTRVAKLAAVEEVVAKNESAGVPPSMNSLAEDERLRQPCPGLGCTLYPRAQSPSDFRRPAVAWKRGVSWGVEMMSTSRIPANISAGQRVVDHRLVVHRKQRFETASVAG